MAGKKIGVEVGVDLLLDPKTTKVKEASVRKQARESLNRALKNVKIKGDKIVFDPNIEVSPQAFTTLKNKIKKEADDIAQAINVISQAEAKRTSVAEESATLRKKGEKVTPRAEQLAKTVSEKDLRLLNDVSKAVGDLTNKQYYYRKSVLASEAAYAKSLEKGTALSRGELTQLNKRATALEEVRRAQAGVNKLTQSRDIYTSQGKLVRQAGLKLEETKAAAVGLDAEARHLTKTLNPLARQVAAVNKVEGERLTVQKLTHKEAQELNAEKLKEEQRLSRHEASRRKRRDAEIANEEKALRNKTNAYNRAAELDRKREAALLASITKVKAAEQALIDKRKAAARVALASAKQVYARPASASDAQAQLNEVPRVAGYLRGRRDDAVKEKDIDRAKRFDDQLRKLGRRKEELIGLRKEFNKVSKSVNEVGKVAGKTDKPLATMNEKLGQSSLLIRQFFRYALGYGALYQMLGAVQALTSGVVELDKALFSIKAITAATDEQMTQISGSIKEVAVDTKFTTTEVAKAAQVLAQAGVDPDQINSVLSSVAQFAAGTESSIAVAADLVSTMRNVYKELDDLTIANQLTKAINISKLTGEDLKTILGISAQVTKRFNITSEQYLAAVTTLRNAGLKASTVATGLRQGLLEIFSPDAKTVKDLKQRYADIGEALGTDEIKAKFFAFTQEANPMLATLRELKRLGFAGAGRKTLSRSLDVRAANAIVALIQNIDELEQAEGRLVTGNSALDASQTQMDSLSNSVDNLGAAMTVLASDISEGPVRALEDIVDAATDAIKALDDLHVASIGKGGEGLLTAVKTGAAGGLVGALAGRTPLKKALLGVGGAVVGAAGGAKLAEGDNQQLATDAADAALLAATLIPLFSGLGKVARKGLSLFRTSKIRTVLTSVEAGTARSFSLLAAITGVFSKVVNKFKAMGKLITKSGLKVLPGLVARMGVRFIPFIGWLWTAYEVASALFDLGGDKEAKSLEALKRKTEGLKRQGVKQNQKVTKLESTFEGYQTTDIERGVEAKPGQTAEKVESIQAAIEDYNFAYEKLFGDIGVTKRAELQEVFRQLRTIGSEADTPARNRLLGEVESISGVVASGLEGQSQDLFQRVVNGYNEINNALIGQAADINAKVDAIYGQEAEDLSDESRAYQQAYEQEIGKNVDILTALRSNIIGEDPSKITNALLRMYQAVYDIGVESVNLSDEQTKKLEIAKTRVDASFAELANDPNATAADLQNTISGLLASAEGVGVEVDEVLKVTLERLTKYQSELEDRKKTEEAKFLAAARELNSFKWGLSIVDILTGARGKAQKGKNDAAGVVRATEAQIDAIDSFSASVVGSLQRRQDELTKKNRDYTKEVEVAVDAVAFEGPEIRSAMAEVLNNNKSLDALFKTIFEVATDEVGQAGIVSDLTKATSDTGEILRKPAKELLKLIESYISKQASVPASSGGSRGNDRALQLGYIKDPAAHKRLAELDVEIEKAQKTNLQKLTTMSATYNPLIEKRDLLNNEVSKELQVQRLNVLRAEKALKEADSSDNVKQTKQLNQARVKLVDISIKKDKIDADAEKKVFNARLKLAKRREAKEIASLNSQKKIADNLAKGAILAGDTAGLATWQAQRLAIGEKIIQAQATVLRMEQSDAEATEALVATKREQLALQEGALMAQKQAALSERKLRFDQGDYTTRTDFGDAFDGVTDNQRSRETISANLAPQIQNVSDELVRYNEMLAQSIKLNGDNTEATEAYRRRIEDLQGRLGTLTGEFHNLNAVATVSFQLDRANDIDRLRAKFQGLGSDITNLGDTIQGNFVRAVDSLGSAITGVALDGGNLVDTLRQTFSDMFRANAEAYLSTAINQGAQSLLGSFGLATPEDPQQQNTSAIEANTQAVWAQVAAMTGSSVLGPGATGSDPISTGMEAVVGAVVGTGKEQQGVTKEVGDMQAAEISRQTQEEGGWFGSLGNIFTSLFSNLVLGGGSGGVISTIAGMLGGFKDGVSKIKIKGYAEGTPGIISGPGTGTSDSIPAVALANNGRIAGPIAVSDGESILTARATSALGADFINRANAGLLKPLKFASGAIMGKIKQKVSSGEGPMKGFSDNSAGAASDAGSTELNLTLVDDRKQVEQVLASPSGGKAVLAHIQRNAKTVKNYIRAG